MKPSLSSGPINLLVLLESRTPEARIRQTVPAIDPDAAGEATPRAASANSATSCAGVQATKTSS
jgi:hypothetical protein